MARHALRNWRDKQDLTQEAAALLAQVATSTWRDWELGISAPRSGQRRTIAERLGVPRDVVNRWFDGQRAPNGHSVPSYLTHLMSLEQGAAALWAFEATTVHGLLQTADYAFAVERGDAIPRSYDQIAERVDLRMARQAVLDRSPGPLDLSVVLDEFVLRRVAGGHEVMAAQLDQLAVDAERPNVDLRILPHDAGVFVFGSFSLFTKEGVDSPYMAIVEDRAGANYLERPPDLEAHIVLSDHLADVALPSAESIDLIRTILKETYQ